MISLYLRYMDVLNSIVDNSFALFDQNNMSLNDIISLLTEQFQELRNHEQFNNVVDEGLGEGSSVVILVLVAVLTYFFYRYREQHGGSLSTRSHKLCLHLDVPICATIPGKYDRLIRDIMNTINSLSPTNNSKRATRPSSSTKVGRRRRTLRHPR